MGAKIVGVSLDTAEDQKAFKDDQGFAFPLLSDSAKDFSQMCGVLFPPDHQYAGYIKRSTYLVDPEGKVVKTYRVTDVQAHPQEVLDDLRAVRGMMPAG